METLAETDQEAFFQQIIRKMPSVGDPSKLEELALLSLSMLLRRTTSQDLRNSLARKIKVTVANINPGLPEQDKIKAVRTAASECVKILQTAKSIRPTRRDADQVVTAKHKSIIGKRSVIAAAIVLILATAAAVASMVDYSNVSKKSTKITLADEKTFADQIYKVAEGEELTKHVFDGSIELIEREYLKTVVAKDVPPTACSASGMWLVKKGVLSINGVTPSRISSAIITELCNQEDGNATMEWTPKKTS